MPQTGSSAGTNLPNNIDTLQAAYDPNIGPAVVFISATQGYNPPQSLYPVVTQNLADYDAGDAVTLTAGDIVMSPIYLLAGQKVTKLSFITAASGASTPTNQWAGLAGPTGVGVATDPTIKVLAISADGTTTAIAADTIISFTMGTAYTVPTSAWYYAFICVAASTGPTVAGITVGGGHGRGAQANYLGGIAGTGKTTPPAVASTLADMTSGTGVALVYVT